MSAPTEDPSRPAPTPGETTRLLAQVKAGDEQAAARLLPLVYDELRAIAGALMRGERKAHTLQPTEVVHEAWMRMFGEQEPSWTDRRHFVAIAARAMRNLLVDHARRRGADKRGSGERPITLVDGMLGGSGPDLDVLALHEALEKLAAKSPIQARIVELRYFGGLTIDETSEIVGLSTTSVENHWATAKARLHKLLSGPPA